jgi:serine/threonine protein kinase
MRAGDLPRAEGLRLVLEVAKAVAHCHQRGVIHRDLKPSNVLIDASGQARLTDLGVAKALGEAGELTATGQRVGTPSYMAPEQIADAKAAGKAVDVYGLGGLLYAVLTGQPPYFRTGSWRATLVAVLRGEFPPPRELDPTVGEALNGLCCRCLAVDPKARPESVVAFVAELSGISE